jgi:hypothetical protein
VLDRRNCTNVIAIRVIPIDDEKQGTEQLTRADVEMARPIFASVLEFADEDAPAHVREREAVDVMDSPGAKRATIPAVLLCNINFTEGAALRHILSESDTFCDDFCRSILAQKVVWSIDCTLTWFIDGIRFSLFSMIVVALFGIF